MRKHMLTKLHVRYVDSPKVQRSPSPPYPPAPAAPDAPPSPTQTAQGAPAATGTGPGGAQGSAQQAQAQPKPQGGAGGSAGQLTPEEEAAVQALERQGGISRKEALDALPMLSADAIARLAFLTKHNMTASEAGPWTAKIKAGPGTTSSASAAGAAQTAASGASVAGRRSRGLLSSFLSDLAAPTARKLLGMVTGPRTWVGWRDRSSYGSHTFEPHPGLDSEVRPGGLC